MTTVTIVSRYRITLQAYRSTVKFLRGDMWIKNSLRLERHFANHLIAGRVDFIFHLAHRRRDERVHLQGVCDCAYRPNAKGQ